MLAVVNDVARGGITERVATPAQPRGLLEQRNREPLTDELNSRRQAA